MIVCWYDCKYGYGLYRVIIDHFRWDEAYKNVCESVGYESRKFFKLWILIKFYMW